MHEHIVFLLTALLILLYGLVSRVSERFYITAPMFFAGVGVLVSPLVLGWVDVEINADLIKVLAEITLVLVLFIDATEIKHLGLKKEHYRVPLRMLAIGLPLAALLGFISGWMLFSDMGLIMIALVALILTPTDAALGQAVIKSEKLPASIKNSISIESGLNDGIVLPPILVCIALLTSSATHESVSNNWLVYLLLQLTLGPLIGALIGRLGGRLVEYAAEKNWMSPVFQRLSAMSLAVLAYAFAEMLYGNGFIAAFVAGLFLGVESTAIRERIREFGEAEGQQLALFIFLVFGIVMVPLAYEYWDWTALVYAMLSLTIVRMVPIALSLSGSEAGWREMMFYGWFGPRGIASILYLLMVVGSLGIDGHQYAMSVIILTVMLSIILHGVSAIPFVNIYQRSTGK